MLTENYVVRIYRRGELPGVSVVGVIEAMPTGWQKPFRSLGELMSILAEPGARADTLLGRDADKGSDSSEHGSEP